MSHRYTPSRLQHTHIMHICAHTHAYFFHSHLRFPTSRFILTAHVSHLILGMPVNHPHPSNHQKPQSSGSFPICHYLPLQVWITSQTQPVNRAVWLSSPSLQPNCRCNTQICPADPNSCEPPPVTKQSPFHTQDGYLHAPHSGEQTSSFKSSHANV